MGGNGENDPLRFFDKVECKFSRFDADQFRASAVRVVPPAVARRGAFVARNVVLMPSFRQHRRVYRRGHDGRHVGHGRLVRPDRSQCAPVRRGRNRGRAGAGAAAPTVIEDNCFIGARSRWSRE